MESNLIELLKQHWNDKELKILQLLKNSNSVDVKIIWDGFKNYPVRNRTEAIRKVYSFYSDKYIIGARGYTKDEFEIGNKL